MTLQSAALFDQIAAAIKSDGPNLVKKVKGVIQFIVNPGGAWVVDLKNGSGSVTEGKANGKVDMTLTVSDADMVAIASGKLNPQQAFMRGKLKVKGNMGLAMKLGTVIKAAAASAGGAKAAAPAAKKKSTSNLQSAALFAQIEDAIKSDGANLVKKVKGVIQFIITPGGAWVVDLKNGNGSVTEGKANGKVDMTLTVSDADMVAIASGKLNAQQAFMRGKLKVKGNMGLAMKLGTVIKAASNKSKL